PLGENDGLVVAVVEHDEDARLLTADVLDGMTEALGNVADVSFSERLLAPASTRTEHGHAEGASEDILPLGGVGMPMKLAQRARLHLEHDTRHGRRNRELRAVGAPLDAAIEGFERL